MDEDAPDLCEDLRNVTEGDDVTLTTTAHERLPATVEAITTDHHNDPDVVRETTTIWLLQEGAECVIQVTDGLTRFEQEDSYPRHTTLYDETNKVSLGYITDVEIHGSLEPEAQTADT